MLFIDEGFGSLDADTLRVAMDAIDGLQAMDSKVGVISHVQELILKIVGQAVAERFNKPAAMFKIQAGLLGKQQRPFGIGLRQEYGQDVFDGLLIQQACNIASK